MIITFGRTYSKNYQSLRAEISFELPENLTIDQGYDLARGIVLKQLGFDCGDKVRDDLNSYMTALTGDSFYFDKKEPENEESDND